MEIVEEDFSCCLKDEEEKDDQVIRPVMEGKGSAGLGIKEPVLVTWKSIVSHTSVATGSSLQEELLEGNTGQQMKERLDKCSYREGTVRA